MMNASLCLGVSFVPTVPYMAICMYDYIVLLAADLTEHANSIDACTSHQIPLCSDLCFDLSCKSVQGLLLMHAACWLPDICSISSLKFSIHMRSAPNSHCQYAPQAFLQDQTALYPYSSLGVSA